MQQLITRTQVRAIFEVNYMGMVAMAAAVTPHMIAARSGRIYNVGSGLAYFPVPFMGHYAGGRRVRHGLCLRCAMWLWVVTASCFWQQCGQLLGLLQVAAQLGGIPAQSLFAVCHAKRG